MDYDNDEYFFCHVAGNASDSLDDNHNVCMECANAVLVDDTITRRVESAFVNNFQCTNRVSCNVCDKKICFIFSLACCSDHLFTPEIEVEEEPEYEYGQPRTLNEKTGELSYCQRDLDEGYNPGSGYYSY